VIPQDRKDWQSHPEVSHICHNFLIPSISWTVSRHSMLGHKCWTCSWFFPELKFIEYAWAQDSSSVSYQMLNFANLFVQCSQEVGRWFQHHWHICWKGSELCLCEGRTRSLRKMRKYIWLRKLYIPLAAFLLLKFSKEVENFVPKIAGNQTKLKTPNLTNQDIIRLVSFRGLSISSG